MSFLTLLPELATSLGLVAAGKGVLDSVLGLRAKRRAHNLISSRAMANPELQQLVATRRALNESELRQAVRVIERSIGGLSDADRRRVEEGLHQPNKTGEQRYVEELIKPG